MLRDESQVRADELSSLLPRGPTAPTGSFTGMTSPIHRSPMSSKDMASTSSPQHEFERQKVCLRLSGRHVREERAEALRHCRVCDDSVAKLWIWQVREHRGLNHGHDLAGFGADHGEAENAVVALCDKSLHEAFRLARGLRSQHGFHQQFGDARLNALARYHAYLLVTHVDAWARFCADWAIDPEALLGARPGWDTVRRTEVLARGHAFSHEEAELFLVMDALEGQEGIPESISVPPVPTAEALAREWHDLVDDAAEDE